MLSAVVLAAGTSSRMGKNKLLLPWDSKTVLESTMAKIEEAGLLSLLLILGYDNEKWLEKWLGRELKWRLAINFDFAKGQGTSVAKAATILLNDEDFLHTSGACFFLGDQPLLKPATIKLLAAEWAKNPEEILVPTYLGKRGNPVIFPAWSFVEMSKLQGDAGARGLLQSHSKQVRYFEVEDRGIVTDLDTPETYEMELANYQK